MSADALSTLVDNIPNWLKRLDELDDQIEKRQVDLARLAGTSSQASARSLRNRGSTESLRPRDDDVESPAQSPAPGNKPDTPVPNSTVTGSEANRHVRSITQNDTKEVVATAKRRARAVVHRKEKTESMLSAQDVARKYLSKTMVIVYYDSWVQSFFEELVKFVSASRNLMRKAKMAAKVAEIKRMAELEFPDDEDEDGDDDDGKGLVAGNCRGIMGGRGGPPGAGDIYDQLDKGLEFVQSACEQAAHQFLREGDCTEQVKKIRARLAATGESATKQLAQGKAGDGVGSEQNSVEATPRVYRPIIMRRDDGAYILAKGFLSLNWTARKLTKDLPQMPQCQSQTSRNMRPATIAATTVVMVR
ncbi:uncharacterized protein B0I36DRAFT_240167 [Microdochium trichocladiopsis]|uniref:Uncharacterized protein n=1 Tax=Microdochium trichocladiopsis TaxID=1682393 RepID=A0A9P8YC76_9PEZI|nr:uncharacterized protein B0I36DRAFT_240167 [Microdochium trichocladiopsis]KAH7035602.1 hypothetical protein B0I36DRAFT_240167 [Microdochium trichocladiopsis]